MKIAQVISTDLTSGVKFSARLRSTYLDEEFTIPEIYAIDNFPEIRDSIVKRGDVKKWSHFSDLDLDQCNMEDVEIIIGNEVPEVFLPLEVKSGAPGEPIAIRNILGWIVYGRVSSEGRTGNAFCVQTEEMLTKQVSEFWKIDGPDSYVSCEEMSIDDKNVMELWEKTTELKEGRYEVKVPFKSDPPNFPDNRENALSRLKGLKKRFMKDPEWFAMYLTSMNTLFNEGFVEEVPPESDPPPGRKCYFPHFGTTQPFKPGKIRIVFDGACETKGVSLNSEIFSGPDLMNKLLSVLNKFRLEPHCILADLKAMFHMVSIPPTERDYFRFFWWPDGNLLAEPGEYRWCRHLFGATHSPAVAAFTLRKTALDHIDEYSPEVIECILNHFYVDDLLKSLSDIEMAKSIVRDLTELLAKGGFLITKWMSNNKEILQEIPPEHRATPVAEMGLCDELPYDRALGQRWDAEKDEFCFAVKNKSEPITKRGILKVIASIYDPIGFLCCYLLRAKLIFQEECRRGVRWDEPLNAVNMKQWEKWHDELPLIMNVRIPRCHVPGGVAACEVQLHVFSDASKSSYSSSSYLRAEKSDGTIHCSFVAGKNRLAPLKKDLTIPRLELCAAVQGSKLGSNMCSDFNISPTEVIYWTDSMTVYRYITNTSKSFHTFVANRRDQILECSDSSQWNFVPGTQNPSDYGTRGVRAEDLSMEHPWFKGPDFLWKSRENWPTLPENDIDVLENDPEVKSDSVAMATKTEEHCECIDKLIERYSSWHRLKKGVAWLQKFIEWLKSKKTMKKVILRASHLKAAEIAILRYTQKRYLPNEYKNPLNLKESHFLYKMEPYLNEDKLLAVEGRLQQADLPEETKHPVIVPNHTHVSRLLVRYIHEWKCKHMGMDHVRTMVRQGYWVVGCRAIVKDVLRMCVICKRLYRKLHGQRTGNLPAARVRRSEGSFEACGCDCFGPIYVSKGKKTRAQSGSQKRYIVLYTSMNMRGVSLEILHTMESDSVIQSLSRLEDRRGPIKDMYSDPG